MMPCCCVYFRCFICSTLTATHCFICSKLTTTHNSLIFPSTLFLIHPSKSSTNPQTAYIQRQPKHCTLNKSTKKRHMNLALSSFSLTPPSPSGPLHTQPIPSIVQTPQRAPSWWLRLINISHTNPQSFILMASSLLMSTLSSLVHMLVNISTYPGCPQKRCLWWSTNIVFVWKHKKRGFMSLVL